MAAEQFIERQAALEVYPIARFELTQNCAAQRFRRYVHCNTAARLAHDSKTTSTDRDRLSNRNSSSRQRREDTNDSTIIRMLNLLDGAQIFDDAGKQRWFL